ncbi:unnamed protein product [Orchesella dallaii]|uniref:Uncharacterized protein n=1 Tax=Orchesella dallaii TaxID=48710 RepID=A0ABP1QGD8_9HEXA
MNKAKGKKNSKGFKFLKKSPPAGSSYDPILDLDEEAESKTDFTECAISCDEVTRGEQIKKVWRLRNISSRSNLEALIGSSSLNVEFGEGENKVELRFYLQSESAPFNLVLKDRDRVMKNLSLWCAVVKGGEGNPLAFALKVDMLSENRQNGKVLVAEKALVMQSEKDHRGIQVHQVFLPYLTSQIRSNGQVYNVEYRFQSVNELSFGFTVTQLHCSGNGLPHIDYYQRNLEEFATSNSFYIDVGNEEDKIQLRFYLEPIHARTASYNWDNRISKLLSLSAAVVPGGEGKKLAFEVKIDLLAESLGCEQTLLEVKRLTFNSEEEKEGKNIQTGFLCYASSRRLSSGNEYDEVYCFESQFQLVLGFTVKRLY